MVNHVQLIHVTILFYLHAIVHQVIVFVMEPCFGMEPIAVSLHFNF